MPETARENRYGSSLGAVRVVRLGPGAEEAFIAGGGRVLSVFERCLYLIAESGAIACLGALELGDGPLQISLGGPDPNPWSPAGLKVNDTWRIAGATLSLSDCQRFDLSTARPWCPLPPSFIDTEALGDSLSRLSRLTPNKLPDIGLGYLVPILAAIAGGGEARLCALSRLHGRQRSEPVARTAEPLIGGLFQTSGVDESRLPEVALGLLGLGPGLTPSGDDFVGGLLIALRHLGSEALAERIGRQILPECTGLTNLISAAYLRWAARGIGGSALHGTLEALCRVERGAQDANLSALSAVGHSSGWDALAGAVLGCAIWTIR